MALDREDLAATLGLPRATERAASSLTASADPGPVVAAEALWTDAARSERAGWATEVGYGLLARVRHTLAPTSEAGEAVVSDRTIAANGWTLPKILEIFRAVIRSFEPDYAMLYDEAQRDRSTYDERMLAFDMRRAPLGLFWINYYGAGWVKGLGWNRIERLRDSVASIERLEDGGALIALQETPYDESVAAHREHQLELERLLGLEEVQAGFPNPGI